MFTVRRAVLSDRAFYDELDGRLSEAAFEKKLRDGEYFVAEEDGVPAGVLRCNFFWDSVPFCTLLYVRAGHRFRGCGRALTEFWEAEMRSLGYDFVLVSTQADEGAQHFYRRLGYRDCGCLLLDVPGHEQPAELFLLKDLRRPLPEK